MPDFTIGLWNDISNTDSEVLTAQQQNERIESFSRSFTIEQKVGDCH